MPFKWFFALFTSVFLLTTPVFAKPEVVNVYSFREAKLIQPLIDEFYQQTGIKVNVVSGKADKLLARLIEDGQDSFADLLLTSNVARLEKAKQLGLIQPIQSDYLNRQIPSTLRDQDEYWYGISVRARAIFYARDRVNHTDIKRYQDLTDAKWRGKICVRKGSHVYNTSMLASFISLYGEQWAAGWAQKLAGNLAMRPQGGDRDQLRNINNGVCDLAIANSYYYGMMSASDKQADRAVYQNVGIIWPEQQGAGAHVNISGAALTSAAKNKANAIAFIEFLLMPKAQKIYAEINFESPVRNDIKQSALVESWGPFVADYQSIGQLSRYLDKAEAIVKRTPW